MEEIDLKTATLGLSKEGMLRLLSSRPGPPQRIDGYTIATPFMTREPPHAGEMHPDGDELLLLLSGRITVILEDQDPPREQVLGPGDALVVPKGVWHRVKLQQPSQLLFVTPGPGGEWRPPTK